MCMLEHNWVDIQRIPNHGAVLHMHAAPSACMASCAHAAAAAFFLRRACMQVELRVALHWRAHQRRRRGHRGAQRPGAERAGGMKRVLWGPCASLWHAARRLWLWRLRQRQPPEGTVGEPGPLAIIVCT